MGEQPPSRIIEKEIRSLVTLLNDASYIQTIGSCSGHPQMPERKWRDGWITMEPVGSPEKLWDFLDALRARLDNATAMKMMDFYQSLYSGLPQEMYADKIYEHYMESGGEDLFLSGIPILTINYSFTLCPFCTPPDKALLIWERILGAVQEFVPHNVNRCIPVHTAEANAKALVRQLCAIPHVQGTVLVQDDRGRWRVEFEAMADRESCLRCWSLVGHVHGALSQGEEFQLRENGRAQFIAHGCFGLRPVVKNDFVERTREDHLKIWGLIESAARELIYGEMSNGTGTLEVPEKQTTRELVAKPSPVGRVRQAEPANEDLEAARSPQVIMYVEKLIVDAVRQGASEVHITPSGKDMMIQYKATRDLGEAQKLPEETQTAVVDRIKLMARMDITQKCSSQRGSIERVIPSLEKEVHMRVSCVPSQYKQAVIIEIQIL